MRPKLDLGPGHAEVQSRQHISRHESTQIKNQAGFTMLELSIGLAIMAIIVIYTTPNLIEDLNEKRANITAQETQTLIDAARTYRIREGNGQETRLAQMHFWFFKIQYLHFSLGHQIKTDLTLWLRRPALNIHSALIKPSSRTGQELLPIFCHRQRRSTRQNRSFALQSASLAPSLPLIPSFPGLRLETPNSTV